MAGGHQNLNPADLYLLAAQFNEATGAPLDALCKTVRSMTGLSHAFIDADRRVPLRDALTTWQTSAADDGLLTPADPSTLALTAEGVAALDATFGAGLLKRRWPDVAQKFLIGRALGFPQNASAQRLKRIETAQGLRLAIVRRGWDLRVPESANVGQVRNALAARALADAFGKPIEGQIGPNTRLSAKAGRTIAAQLLDKRRRVSSDSQLLTALAAQVLDIPNGDVRSLRQALLRRLFGFAKKVDARVEPATLDETKSAQDQAPDEAAFLRAVKSSAKLNANGWSGNRKAYISHVWRTLCDSYPEWRLGSDLFKSKLIEAHQEGHIVLVNADLRDKNNIRDVQDSAIQYHNMEWHFVQIAD